MLGGQGSACVRPVCPHCGLVCELWGEEKAQAPLSSCFLGTARASERRHCKCPLCLRTGQRLKKKGSYVPELLRKPPPIRVDLPGGTPQPLAEMQKKGQVGAAKPPLPALLCEGLCQRPGLQTLLPPSARHTLRPLRGSRPLLLSCNLKNGAEGPFRDLFCQDHFASP